MSGIQTHQEDPITPVKADGITPHTAYSADTSNATKPATITAKPSYGYIPAQPGGAAAKPTGTVASSSSSGASYPQPGAVRVPPPPPPPPTTTAKAYRPPPPKANEKALPPEYYAPVQSAPPHPPQGPLYPPPPDSSIKGVPPSSITSESTVPSFPVTTAQSNVPALSDVSSRGSLEHPPGYAQNQYAMAPDQQSAPAQQANQSDTLPSLGYTGNRKAPNSNGLGDEESVWDAAKKWAKEKGEQASEFHGQVWDKLNGSR